MYRSWLCVVACYVLSFCTRCSQLYAMTVVLVAAADADAMASALTGSPFGLRAVLRAFVATEKLEAPLEEEVETTLKDLLAQGETPSTVAVHCAPRSLERALVALLPALGCAPEPHAYDAAVHGVYATVAGTCSCCFHYCSCY